ncbi:MAG: UDP-N-acetylmuramoyl-L-alanine--D-glutamate ligase [Microgenomates group bacterium]|nr:MAG: UDP-N-acetylmuramoyl-L-alanine--D-glutamate ligase [Candidatus Roizmanbacteria bacterium]
MNDRFEFGTYSLDLETLECSFNYISVHNGVKRTFVEKLILPYKPSRLNIPQELLDRVLKYLHLTIGVSYFKIFVQDTVVVPYVLSTEEAAFFTILYKKGLGEFYYRNNLSLKKAPIFPSDESIKREPFTLESSTDNILVGLGGGKDSIVALELLKEQGFAPSVFIVGGEQETALHKSLVEKTKSPAYQVKRILDQQLFSPIQDSYNGHVPVSAIYSLVGYLLALLYHFSYIVVGNEHSSNFGNILFESTEINHQWSKSIEYEHLFQDLCRSSLSPNIVYFSLLRPFYEIRIVEQFMKYPEYLHSFTSCNRAFRIKKPTEQLWCGECPKCVFVFLLCSAFMNPEQIVSVFGQNLFEKEALLPLFKDVLGNGTMKPFDCVGTFEEAKVAFVMAEKHFGDEKIYQYLKPTIEVSQADKDVVFRTVMCDTIPHQFRFSGMKNVLIVGYGKEGRAIEAYLRQIYPQVKLEIADEKTHPDNFSKQELFDIALRSPGVPKEKVKIPSTTGTNLFFALTKNVVVGITGTKGKSTVTTLIGHILKTAGKNIKILGNIGEPLIEELLKQRSTDRIYVVELSSYQLDDLDFSPHIAVVTSLYNDHLDYHGSSERYVDAKKRIIKFQTNNDLFIYNNSFAELKEWSRETRANSKPYDVDFQFDQNSVKLKGPHNIENIHAAITVCRALGVSDEDIASGLKSYVPLPHRLENIGTLKGITFYDDAIAVIPEATIAALQSLDKVDTLLLGGTDRGYDFTQLEKVVKEKGVRNLVLFPDTGKRMFEKDREDFNILETDSMKEAVTFAYRQTKSGATCLLSTASPSYRLWKNFEEKGDEFKKWVEELGRTT